MFSLIDSLSRQLDLKPMYIKKLHISVAAKTVYSYSPNLYAHINKQMFIRVNHCGWTGNIKVLADIANARLYEFFSLLPVDIFRIDICNQYIRELCRP